MEKTYILGNSQSICKLSENIIEIPNLINALEIHDWVIKIFQENDIKKVIIEIGENQLCALQIGYHIRLSIEELKEKSLVPILFISTFSLNVVMLGTEIYSQILATKGVFFSEFDLQSNKTEIAHITGLSAQEYLTKFLKTVHIQPDETVGRHSLANIWGAYVMDKAANAYALSNDAEFKKNLYFKYITAFNNISKLTPSPLKVRGHIKVGNTNKIEAEGNKILFIDDEADKGWETVLRKVFKTKSADDFVVINEKVKDYNYFSESSKDIIENNKFDLYLIDLRLNGIDEEDNMNTDVFSGMKVMKKIKLLNQGHQVIIFTASNKSWNLKSLLDKGADGYYLKESPEYKFTEAISEQNYTNFKNNVRKCFEKNHLSKIYNHWQSAEKENTNKDQNFIQESSAALEIAWELIKKNQLDFGYLTLFQSIESLANDTYTISETKDTIGSETTIDKTQEDINEWKMKFIKDSQNGFYFVSEVQEQEKSRKPTTLFKISCLFKIKYKKEDVFLKRLGRLNKLRNDIVHGKGKGLAHTEDLADILDMLKELRKK